MERAERETLILINFSDLDRGFFKISTTIPSHKRRIEKRAKGRIIEVREEKLTDGSVFGWEYKISSSALNQTLFCIKGQEKQLRPEILEAKKRAGLALSKLNRN